MTKATLEHIQSIVDDEIGPDTNYDLFIYGPGDEDYYSHVSDDESVTVRNAPEGLDTKILGLLEDVPADAVQLEIYVAHFRTYSRVKLENGMEIEHSIWRHL